jgi:hypothetical protein
MANTGLNGPYKLDESTIDRVVTRKSPGAYALGASDSNTFYIRYVGRSDVDIAARLKQHVGKYPHFKFDYYSTAKAAFGKECGLYHDFGGPQGQLDNEVHPARPDGTDWQCPRCSVFAARRVAQW